MAPALCKFLNNSSLLFEAINDQLDEEEGEHVEEVVKIPQVQIVIRKVDHFNFSLKILKKVCDHLPEKIITLLTHG